MKTVKFLLPLLLFALPAAAAAKSGDRDQPIEVEADSLEVRDDENISVYEGNVRLVQGSLEINSDRLVIRFNQARELELMEMTGTPARFRQLDDDDREMLGRARQINYSGSGSMLELFDEAYFSHAGDTIEGDRILINTDDNSIQAGSDDSSERVKMLIQPRQQTAPAE